MFSRPYFLLQLLPVAVSAASSCLLSSNNQTLSISQTQPPNSAGPTNQTQPIGGNGTAIPPDDATWIPTCKLPAKDGVSWSVGHGFQKDCVSGTGAIQAQMIFVDFSDAEAAPDDSPQETRDFFIPSAVEWYRNASYGRLELNITADVSKFYRMPNTAESYHWDEGLNAQVQYAYIEDALAAYTDNGAKPPPPFSDVLYIVPARGNYWFSRSYGSVFGAYTRDNQRVSKSAVTFGDDPYQSWGYKILTHETGHSMCLADYYPTDQILPTPYYTGGWSVMGNVGGIATDYFAWDKWRLGWLADDAIDCVLEHGTTQHALSPLEVEGGVKAVVIATNKTSALVAEARTAKGVDYELCAPGVLLYTIDTMVPSGQGPIHVLDTTPESGMICGNSEWEMMNDAALSSSRTKSYEVPGWGIKVTLVDDKNDIFKIEVEYS